MLTSTFQFSLKNQVFDGLCVLGKSNSDTTYLAAATSAGKVLIHSPANQQYLNINKKITDIAVGPLAEKNPDRDVILVGTPANVMAYDIEDNSELFMKEVTDGCTRLRFGRREPFGPVCLVGGHCSVQGFDQEGSELFWSVVGDTVSAVAFAEGPDCIADFLVATEDNELAAFSLRGGSCSSVGSPLTEVDIVTHLECISSTMFAYALKNGTVGVYKMVQGGSSASSSSLAMSQAGGNWAQRLWRVAAKNEVRGLKLLEGASGGIRHVVIGWSTGKVEVRNQMTGEILFKETLAANNMSSLVIGRYRNDGMPNIIAITNTGEVHGFLAEQQQAAASGASASSAAAKSMEKKKKAEKNMGLVTADTKTEEDNEAYRAMLAERQDLQNELKSFDEQIRQMKESGGRAGLIPTDTKLQVSLETSPDGLRLRLATNNYSVIRGCVIYAEHLFEDQEAQLTHFAPAKNENSVSISATKNAEIHMKIHCYCGVSATSEQYHTFEQTVMLPKFSMFHFVTEGKLRRPAGNVKIVLPVTASRIWQWLAKNFINAKNPNPSNSNAHLQCQFVSLRKQTALLLETSDSPNNRNELQFVACTDDLELAAEIIEDLTQHLQVKELDAAAHFPSELEELTRILKQVEGHNATRLKLTAEIADSSNLVKALVVKAEDYRILADMKNLRRAYQVLQNTNGDMIAEHTKRAGNYQELLSHLKKVNQALQNAGRLRCGSAKSRTVQACRQAIKANNIGELCQIIQTGAK
ncbi:unnamed protein product [Amoebophrya sp. A120]|nr:unnamed protein product [Amoebophrya sp. A120]|eukprot:GSA120T00000435001.1